MMTARPYDAVLCDIEGVIRHAAICGSADRAHAAVTDWSNLVPHADHDVLSLLTQARTVVTVASVSNAPPGEWTSPARARRSRR
ncbi:hypothetical protein [Streptomyces hygroscopicus]|uniref:hypothetical protein n=1 Tax=Streptomyces hygroscopicus TaxID=1912 RepID=UPI00202E8972|nr:hypothetical protein [Streptomyces hygroscopicus]